ncbi:hypothetical protein Pint_18840 [Pistacia integerrima]|uniref:Uncharacterized protein n=1 Tax=Pistacia integerrima TaxID=434235 RepID=A0ACC0Z1R5_9ROSI|nr:hypothetical protein Pint_18840 [Pistacia integerrima]
MSWNITALACIGEDKSREGYLEQVKRNESEACYSVPLDFSWLHHSQMHTLKHLFHILKVNAGGQVMLQKGMLATSDVKKVAEAHVHLYEAMNYGACGRYHCFERIIRSSDEAIKLETELKMPGLLSEAQTDEIDNNNKLSNSRLANLLYRTSQRLSCKE